MVSRQLVVKFRPTGKMTVKRKSCTCRIACETAHIVSCITMCSRAVITVACCVAYDDSTKHIMSLHQLKSEQPGLPGVQKTVMQSAVALYKPLQDPEGC